MFNKSCDDIPLGDLHVIVEIYLATRSLYELFNPTWLQPPTNQCYIASKILTAPLATIKATQLVFIILQDMNVDNGTINQHDDNHSPNIYNYNTTITAHLRRDLTPEMNKEATAADSEPQVTEATSILYHNNCFTYRDYIFHPSQKCKCLSASDLLSVLLLILLLIDHSYIRRWQTQT